MNDSMLSRHHREELEIGSAIEPDVIAERGYFTAKSALDLPPAFADYQRRPGLVIPIRDVTGTVVAWQLKATKPRRDKAGKLIKYDTAAGGRHCIDVPARSRQYLDDPRVSLWVGEGAKKIDSGLSNGIHSIIGVAGVYGWRGTNAYGGKTVLADWEPIALNGRTVVLAFDSDCMTKSNVRGALERLAAFLQLRQACVRYLILPPLANGEKQGLDDFFANGGEL